MATKVDLKKTNEDSLKFELEEYLSGRFPHFHHYLKMYLEVNVGDYTGAIEELEKARTLSHLDKGARYLEKKIKKITLGSQQTRKKDLLNKLHSEYVNKRADLTK